MYTYVESNNKCYVLFQESSLSSHLPTWVLEHKLSNTKIKLIFPPNVLFFQAVPTTEYDLISHLNAGGGFQTCP